MILEQILDTAIKEKASDIHMTVGLPPIARINGRLLHMGKEKMANEDTTKFVKKMIGDYLYSEFEKTGECDASYSYKDIYNFRVNAFRQKNNVGVVLRLIPSKIPSMEELGLPDVIKQICMTKRGLIIVTGPTGSGKTTTLAAMIDYMTKHRNEHIITVEDPIEYIFNSGNGIVNQRQLGSDTKSFTAAIQSALREDIDVIMVGEMRDFDTISAAITAAETGHLVLSTLHTLGAAKTVDRIINAYPAEQQAQIKAQISSVLQAVISQQLVPNLSETGRCLAVEVMIVNHAIKNLLREGAINQIQNQIQMGLKEGMVTMDSSLQSLYRSNKISEEMMKQYMVEKSGIKLGGFKL